MLARLLLDRAQGSADSTAVVCGAQRLTYAQLDELVDRLCHRLATLSLGRNACVAAILPNSVEFVVSFFATARLGTMFFPLNPLAHAREVRRYLLQCDARALIVDAEDAERCRALLAELGRRLDLLVLDDAALSSMTAEACRDGERADDPFLVQFSSGSTGRLKQVRRTRRNLVAEARNFATSVCVTRDDRILCTVPLYHAHGLGNGLLAAMYAGATLILGRLDGSAPLQSRCEQILQLVERERATVFPGVPYVFEAMAHTPPERQVDLSSLRWCFSAGNSLSRSTFDAFRARFGVPIRQLYGCTEAGSITMNLDADVEATWNSVGRPLGTVDVRVVDESGHEVSVGTDGEIVLRSPALSAGYVNAPDANAASYQDGSFVTGDLGRKDEAGRLYIIGRKRRFIDTGGYKVDPVEVEDVLMSHPKVAEAVVVGVDAAGQTELVKAAVVCREPCTMDEIVAHCRSHLAGYEVPALVEFLSEIPKSPLGKILRAPIIESSTHEVPGDAEAHVREIVADLLGIDAATVDRDRPLMDYGVDSIKAVELALRLERALQTAISVTLIWNHPTLASIGAALGQRVRPSLADQAMLQQDAPESAFEPSVVEEIAALSDAEILRRLSR